MHHVTHVYPQERITDRLREEIMAELKREGLAAAEAAPAIAAAEGARIEGFLGTDEASLLERAGEEVHVVMGTPRNIKITTPADLELAEFYLAQEKLAQEKTGPKA